MSNSTTVSTFKAAPAPDYLGWRSELLGQLALARLPNITVFKPGPDLRADYLVASNDGFCFFVIVQAFSSIRLDLPNVAELGALDWRVNRSLIQRAKRSRIPVVLFLFDADTGHGRFLRLDSLPLPRKAARSVRLRLPNENAITRESLELLVSQLHSADRQEHAATSPQH